MSGIRMAIQGDNNLSPEDRYLLLSVYIEVVSYGNGVVDVSSARLVSDFGATTKVVKTVVDYLVKKKNVKLVDLPKQGRKLIFSQSGIDTLVEEWLDIPAWKQYRILCLFTPDKRKILIPTRMKNRSIDVVEEIRLRNSNLFLMFIFLYHSNDIGLVRELTHRNIQKMMGGISRDRLKSQMKSLRHVGFFRAESTGGTSKLYFKKVNKRYMINLEHLNNESDLIEFNDVNLLRTMIGFLRVVGSKDVVYGCATRQCMVSELDMDVFKDTASIIHPILRNVEDIINLGLREQQFTIALDFNEQCFVQRIGKLVESKDDTGGLIDYGNNLMVNFSKSLSLKKCVSLVVHQVMFYFLVSSSWKIMSYIISVVNEFYDENIDINDEKGMKDMNVMFHDLVYARNGNLFSYKCAIDFKLNEQPVIIDIDAERIEARKRPCRYQYIVKSKGLTLKTLEVTDVDCSLILTPE